MVTEILALFQRVFENCIDWTAKLLEAVDGTGVIIAGFIITLVVSLLLIPIRGGRVSDMSSLDSFTRNVTHSKKKDK